MRFIYLDEQQIIDNGKYIVSLFFRNGKIYMVSLICCDKEFSEKEEKKRKIISEPTTSVSNVRIDIAVGVQMATIWCATMQMLNGEDPNEWWVDIKYVDIETGNTVLECKDFPRTSKDFSVNLEDWEKARK